MWFFNGLLWGFMWFFYGLLWVFMQGLIFLPWSNRREKFVLKVIFSPKIVLYVSSHGKEDNLYTGLSWKSCSFYICIEKPACMCRPSSVFSDFIGKCF